MNIIIGTKELTNFQYDNTISNISEEIDSPSSVLYKIGCKVAFSITRLLNLLSLYFNTVLGEQLLKPSTKSLSNL